MSFSPTDAITMSVALSTPDESFAFDCLEVHYKARMNGMYSLRVLLCTDVSSYALEAEASNIQIDRWAKVTV